MLLLEITSALEQFIGMKLGFHDIFSSLNLPIERKEHRSTSCLKMKAKDFKVCHRHCGSGGQVDRELSQHPDGWVHPCPWGLHKINLPLMDSKGHLEGYLFAVSKEGERFSGLELELRRKALLPLKAYIEKKVHDSIIKSSKEENRAQTTLEFIGNNLDKPIMAEDLAKFLKLSPSRTRGWIKSHFGVNFSRILSNERIKRTEQLLIHTRLSISQISERFHFYDSSQFSRAFKEYQGVSPIKFRKSYQDRV